MVIDVLELRLCYGVSLYKLIGVAIRLCSGAGITADTISKAFKALKVDAHGETTPEVT